MENYGMIFLFLLVGLSLSFFLVSIPFIIAKYRPYKAKLSPYECGIDPSGDARMPFNVKFIVVAILFVIFDVEVVLLFPFAVHIKNVPLIGFISVMMFFATLGIGLIYEFKSKALDWSSR